MGNNDDLARLEQFVEKLIESHNQLKSENSEINAQLREKQREVKELQETIKSLQEDRSVVHNRVTGLIDRIDEWEKGFEQAPPADNSAAEKDHTENLSQKSTSLFSVSDDKPSESALR